MIARSSRVLRGNSRTKPGKLPEKKRMIRRSSKSPPRCDSSRSYTGLSTGNAYLLSILLNFAVIAGIIFWAARKYLPGAFSARTAAIQKAMQEAQKASEEARRQVG